MHPAGQISRSRVICLAISMDFVRLLVAFSRRAAGEAESVV